MRDCSLVSNNEHIRKSTTEELKPNMAAPAPIPVVKQKLYKNIKDDRPKFTINMGYSNYRMAEDHLKLVMNKEGTKWSEDDDNLEDKLSGQLEWFWPCVDKALEARLYTTT